MERLPPSVLPVWLKFLTIFAMCNLACALLVVAVAHAVSGPMRPMNGFFVMGAAALALIAVATIAARYVWIVVRR